MKPGKNIKFFINYFLGPVLFIWLAYSLYNEIKNQPNLGESWKHIRRSFSGPMIINVIIVLLLMIVNWAIEAFKWQLSVRKVQEVSFFKAFRAVLSGVSFSVSTPNRVGEYIGRVLYMDDGNRIKAIALTIVGSMSQLLITIVMGFLGLLILYHPIERSHMIGQVWLNVIVYGVLAVLLGLTLFYFRLAWLVKAIDRLPGISKYTYWIRGLENFNATLLLQLLSLSLLRFFVFIIQYYLLFRLFDVEMNLWQVCWSISLSFLVLAVIPTIAIAELVQRGKIVTTLAGLFSANGLGIGLATASIWFINLIMPAVVGSLLIFSIKKILNHRNERI